MSCFQREKARGERDAREQDRERPDGARMSYRWISAAFSSPSPTGPTATKERQHTKVSAFLTASKKMANLFSVGFHSTIKASKHTTCREDKDKGMATKNPGRRCDLLPHTLCLLYSQQIHDGTSACIFSTTLWTSYTRKFIIYNFHYRSFIIPEL